jgi:hypothetical protein
MYEFAFEEFDGFEEEEMVEEERVHVAQARNDAAVSVVPRVRRVLVRVSPKKFQH